MKVLALPFVALLFVFSCGETEDKKSPENNLIINNANNANNQNNGNNQTISNNDNNTTACEPGETQATLNGVTGCFATCSGDADCAAAEVCNTGVCIPSDALNNANNVNNANNENNALQCESVAECRVAQECVDGACQSHLDCFETDFNADDTCVFSWKICDDQREYELDCQYGGNPVCRCLVNGVETDTFVAEGVDACDSGDRIHRTANDSCGWLVPEIPGFQ